MTTLPAPSVSPLPSYCSDRPPFSRRRSVSPHAKAMVAVYDRSAARERRRPVMEQWGRFLSGEEHTAEVIDLAARPA